ncbi:hypothetical protein [Caulobacter sp. NIBR1757]|uniref:hypothetical protein n=1 Tax=Caulobacter sp. NIBR1757 TaxID=3016000 RepID=UPI0022F075DC|nr:hypothetical protein [Caulobacter sp. NIBR1757]WGM39990.1 hypothetical protein AMEJIAPC_02930 [Caulobacter sp. NIBR1757]
MTTIRAPRTKSSIFSLVVSLALFALGFLKFTEPDTSVLERVFVVLITCMWGVFAVVGALSVLFPDRLKLDDEGFAETSLFGIADRYHWADIEAFHVVPAGNRKKDRVGWIYAAEPDAAGAERYSDSFSDRWLMPAAELAALMQSRLEASRR